MAVIHSFPIQLKLKLSNNYVIYESEFLNRKLGISFDLPFILLGTHIDEQETELQLPLITKLLNSKSIGGADSSGNLLSLDEAIHLSINCANEQNKQKLYKNIVVTGAGFQFQKGLTYLQNRLKVSKVIIHS